MQKNGYGHISVITDGQWMDTYDRGSDLENSEVFLSPVTLDDMWFEVDLGNEYLICAVNIYSRYGK